MKLTAETGVPMAELAAMRDEVWCAKGEVERIDRCSSVCTDATEQS